MQQHNYSLRVFFEHTDAGGVVYHANYLNFCEQARTEWLRSFGISQQKLKEELKLGFVVIHADCQWRTRNKGGRPHTYARLQLCEGHLPRLLGAGSGAGR